MIIPSMVVEVLHVFCSVSAQLNIFFETHKIAIVKSEWEREKETRHEKFNKMSKE